MSRYRAPHATSVTVLSTMRYVSTAHHTLKYRGRGGSRVGGYLRLEGRMKGEGGMDLQRYVSTRGHTLCQYQGPCAMSVPGAMRYVSSGQGLARAYCDRA
eukprot:482627-Rhodomonas_salina.3